MITNQWIEIKPGCEMPEDGEWVLVYTQRKKMQWCEFDSPMTFLNRMANSYYVPSHWMRVEAPPKPDAFEEWWNTFPILMPRAHDKSEVRGIPNLTYCCEKNVARAVWDAAIASTKQTT